MSGPEDQIVAPPEWEQIDRSLLQGLIMVVGGADTGKTTFARWLLRRLAPVCPGRLAFVDGDPGQGVLGPPTTVSLATTTPGGSGFPPPEPYRRMFVGATTPRGHMLRHLVGAARLVEAARSQSIDTVIHDTSGLIDPRAGGVALKLAKIELLRPHVVVAIQRSHELEPLLKLLRHSRRTGLVELASSPSVRRRDFVVRREYRVDLFARYFAGAEVLELETSRFAVIPDRALALHQLAAFEDTEGFTLALGIPVQVGRVAQLLTPIRDVTEVDTLRLADLLVDPGTFYHQRIG
jgi:polynucleotide 5'-kinase involved in rRNA processing